QVTIDQRLPERADARRRLHHVVGPDRPPRRDVVRPFLAGAGDPKVGEAEVLHRARRGADVAGVARLDEDDAEVHGLVDSTAGRDTCLRPPTEGSYGDDSGTEASRPPAQLHPRPSLQPSD